MPRNPGTPDCSIDGCGYAVYRAGLCRKHHAMIPFDVKLRSMSQQMMRASEAATAHAAMMKEEVEKLARA